MKKFLRTSVVMSTLLIPQAIAQDGISIAGTAVDVNRAPVAGAVVRLIHRNLIDTTDASGKFALSGPVSVKRLYGPFDRAERPTYHNGLITIPVPYAGIDIRIDRIDLSGRVSSIVRMSDCKAGKFSTALFSGRKNIAGVFFIKVVVSGVSTVLKVMNVPAAPIMVSSAPSVVSQGSGLYKIAAPLADTLIIEKDGILTKRIPVSAAPVDMIDSVFLYPKNPVFSAQDFPSSDGSTSSQPLNMIIACKLLGSSYAWEEQMDGSKKMVAYSSSNPKLADTINNVLIKHTGTHTAYVNVITGAKQLGYICRPPSPDEQHLSDSLKAPIDYPDVALDAFVFLENTKNPVNSLTLSQIQKIYTGEITHWSVVGGWGNKIQPYQREANSGSQELLIALVMKDLKIISAPNMIVLGMMGPFNMLTTDTNGFCYTVYFYQKFMAPASNVKSISVNNMVPDYANIQTKKYELYAPVVLVTRKDLIPTSKAAMLREWLLAPEGQALVKESGYVPIIDQ